VQSDYWPRYAASASLNEDTEFFDWSTQQRNILTVLAHSIPHEINTNFHVLQNERERDIRNAEQTADLGNIEFFPILLLRPSIITLHISHDSFYFFKMHIFYITLLPPLKTPYRAFMWSVAQHFMLLLKMECSCCNFNKGIVFFFFFFLQNPEIRSNSILISQNYNFNKESIDIRHIMLNICRFYRNNFNISIQWIISGFWHCQVQTIFLLYKTKHIYLQLMQQLLPDNKPRSKTETQS
jgi:hypothetical protein